jgi:hypothetical protein
MNVVATAAAADLLEVPLMMPVGRFMDVSPSS